MKWNRFNLLSPAGERRGQPLTDIAVEVGGGGVGSEGGGGGGGGGGSQHLQSPLVNEISATTGGE